MAANILSEDVFSEEVEKVAPGTLLASLPVELRHLLDRKRFIPLRHIRNAFTFVPRLFALDPSSPLLRYQGPGTDLYKTYEEVRAANPPEEKGKVFGSPFVKCPDGVHRYVFLNTAALLRVSARSLLTELHPDLHAVNSERNNDFVLFVEEWLIPPGLVSTLEGTALSTRYTFTAEFMTLNSWGRIKDHPRHEW